ncbi:MAG: hypothetical protein V1739_07980 [Candidatus Omnitrophota bacterium]
MNIWLIISIIINIVLGICLFFKSALNDLLVELVKSIKEKALKLKEHDIELFNLFLKVLPSDGSIKFIDEWNMAGFSFRWSEFDQLKEFAEKWTTPEYEFTDKKIEKLRSELQKKSNKYLWYLATNSWCNKNSVELIASVPPEWEFEQPERFQEVVNKLHESAEEIVDIHRKLVSLGIKKGLKKSF